MAAKRIVPPQNVDAQYAQAAKTVQSEQPQLMAGQAQIGPMGLLTRLLMPGALAITNPLTGSISYNAKANEGQSDANVADTVTHELTHRQQVLQKPLLTRLRGLLSDAMPGLPYHQRPDEIEAYNAEIARAASQGRGSASPDFWTGAMVPREDIPLRSATPRAAMLGALKR